MFAVKLEALNWTKCTHACKKEDYIKFHQELEIILSRKQF